MKQIFILTIKETKKKRYVKGNFRHNSTQILFFFSRMDHYTLYLL